MCLAIPMRISSIDGYMARCETRGIERDVSLFMLQQDQVDVGDYVLVHVGYAIEKISAEEVTISLEYYDEMFGTPGDDAKYSV